MRIRLLEKENRPISMTKNQDSIKYLGNAKPLPLGAGVDPTEYSARAFRSCVHWQVECRVRRCALKTA